MSYNPHPDSGTAAFNYPSVQPSDWPKAGPLDLDVHDLPHESSTMEWWYLNTHFSSAEGRNFSLFASFFRMAVGREEKTGIYRYAHSIAWALVDADNKKYYMDSLVDRLAPEEGLKIINRGKDTTDKLLQDALKEVLEKGKVPLPDRLMQADATVSGEKLFLAYDENTFEKRTDGSYRLCLENPLSAVSVQLDFRPLVKPVIHGDAGVVKGAGGEDMFYYFIPHCEVKGSICLGEEKTLAVSGKGWYDHEFGKPKTENVEAEIRHDIAWNWVSLQLSNGWQFSGYDLFDNLKKGEGCGRWAILIDETGKRYQVTDFEFSPLEAYTSARTFTRYPVTWKLKLEAFKIDLLIHAAFPEQEFITIISKPAFWEGRINACGKFLGKEVEGLGFVERSGFENLDRLEDFFKAVTRETRKSVEAVLPLHPTEQQFTRMVASEKNKHYMNGLDKEKYISQTILPIRQIIDRGGKCWRSYAVLACIDAVGGESQPFLDWLMWPELLHTGSLILDDVQDKSLIRRGGPSCHAVHGEAIAINAGTLSCFLGQVLMLDDRLSAGMKLKVYELYFETMRAAHAGQAMDITGFYDSIPSVVESGHSIELERKILAVHRLKSAVPASMLAQLGAIQGGGSQAQVNGLGLFFEALGLAFQIMDDVLNLRGFKGNLKDRGEDIRAGKITFPVAKAMSRLDPAGRRYLWEKISAKPSEHSVIESVIQKIEQCGALDAAQAEAEALVEDAWRTLDPLIPDSGTKIRLRAFGWFVLNRHY